MNWSARPFLRILLFYLVGILLAQRFNSLIAVNALWVYFFIVVFLLLSVVLIRINTPWKIRSLNGLVVGILVCLLGYWSTSRMLTDTEQDLSNSQQIYLAEVMKDPVIAERSVKTVLKVVPVIKNDSGFIKPVRVMSFFSKDEKSESLSFGDRLLINVRLTKPEPPKNPYEFDYAKFLRLNGIRYSAFVGRDSWDKIASGKAFSIKRIAASLRNYILEKFSNNGLIGQDYSVAAAMILGYDDIMEPELEQNYVQAGAMHILCVSGLHVGVIYFVFNYLLAFLKRNRVQEILRAILLLLVVWFYAVLTGLSPSVQRASVMLSVFIIGSTLQRDRDSLNTLAASAMLMLIYDPLLIFNVGFQLSYSAVLGILLFHRPIYQLFYFRNWLADKIWSITVVSFAAQIGTFPLAAHYFHFFPTYFWFTNIFVLPLSFLIIGTGFFFIVTSWIPLFSSLVGLCLSLLVKILNFVVGTVDFLPLNGLRNIYFPWAKVLLVYLLVILLYQVFMYKKIKLILPVMLTLLMIVVFTFNRNYAVLKQKRMVVYQVNKHSAIAFVNGSNSVCLADTFLMSNEFAVDYQLLNSEISWRTERNTVCFDSLVERPELNFYYDNSLGQFNGFRFAILDGKPIYQSTGTDRIKLDGVIARGNKYLDLVQLQKTLDFELLVLDGSVPYYKQRSLKQAADTLGIECYITSESGAYVKEF